MRRKNLQPGLLLLMLLCTSFALPATNVAKVNDVELLLWNTNKTDESSSDVSTPTENPSLSAGFISDRKFLRNQKISTSDDNKNPTSYIIGRRLINQDKDHTAKKVSRSERLKRPFGTAYVPFNSITLSKMGEVSNSKNETRQLWWKIIPPSKVNETKSILWQPNKRPGFDGPEGPRKKSTDGNGNDSPLTAEGMPPLTTSPFLHSSLQDSHALHINKATFGKEGEQQSSTFSFPIPRQGSNSVAAGYLPLHHIRYSDIFPKPSAAEENLLLRVFPFRTNSANPAEGQTSLQMAELLREESREQNLYEHHYTLTEEERNQTLEGLKELSAIAPATLSREEEKDSEAGMQSAIDANADTDESNRAPVPDVNPVPCSGEADDGDTSRPGLASDISLPENEEEEEGDHPGPADVGLEQALHDLLGINRRMMETLYHQLAIQSAILRELEHPNFLRHASQLTVKGKSLLEAVSGVSSVEPIGTA